jgi:hypothetical protein
VISTLGAFLTVTALGFVAPTLPEPQRIGIVAAASLLAPIVAYLIGGPGYDTFSGSVGAILAMLGLGALYAFAVAVIARLLQLGVGAVGAVIGSLVLIFLNVPSSGGSVAAPLLPGFWRFLSHFWIGAAALDANRSALYFGGSGVAQRRAQDAGLGRGLRMPTCGSDPPPTHAPSPREPRIPKRSQQADVVVRNAHIGNSRWFRRGRSINERIMFKTSWMRSIARHTPITRCPTRSTSPSASTPRSL